VPGILALTNFRLSDIAQLRGLWFTNRKQEDNDWHCGSCKQYIKIWKTFQSIVAIACKSRIPII